MTKDEALKMAIEEMTNAIPHLDIHFDDYFEAINACKEALEQPTQDYVLICKRCGDELGLEYVPDEQPKMTYEQGFAHGYEAHSAEWQSLSGEEMIQIYLNNYLNKYENIKCGMGRAIEQALKEKNT